MSSDKSFRNIYYTLQNKFDRMDPHHDTWELWLKHNKTAPEFFEVSVGTILVQNTSWRNVAQSIKNLEQYGITSFKDVLNVSISKLKDLIRPSGFYNQKSIYLKSVSNFFQKKGIFKVVDLEKKDLEITRKELLAIKGVGNETADSILNFCLKKPVAIVGNYTRRLLSRFYAKPSYKHMKYLNLKKIVEQNLPAKAYELGHFHALIVVLCQTYCTKKQPNCHNCVLRIDCSKANML